MLKTVGFPSSRTGDQTIIDGNLVIGTDGKGIDFSATPGTGTSELLNDYEEGTWTPTVTFAAGSATLNSSITSHTKIGRLVNVSVRVTITTTSVGTSNLTIGGLPFTSLTASPRFFAAMTQTNYSSSLINDGVKAIVAGGTTLVWTDRAVPLIDTTFFLDFNGSYVV